MAIAAAPEGIDARKMESMDYPAVAAAKALIPLLREHRAEEEAENRLAPEVVEAAGRAGMFRLFAPGEVGGLETPLPVAAEVFELLAAEDPSLT